MADKESVARENILKKSKEISGVKIKGYDFNQGVNYAEIIKSFGSTGYQATFLSDAISITNEMIDSGSRIFLGYTSNMVSSGLRDIFRYLVQHKMVHSISTTAGGVEEDIIKCLGDFILGDFRASGKHLRENAINRIGNIFVPNSRYIAYEKFLQPLLEELYQEQISTGKPISASDFIWRLGERINDERSICYWAWKNKIRIYCSAITDGSTGDNIYFFKYSRPDFVIDIAEDIKRLNDSTMEAKKTSVLILGTGLVKHSLLNANLFRNGADYAVYINNAAEFDGSDAGALPEEAVSWGKIRTKSRSVKVFGDATVLFPLLVAETFAKNQKPVKGGK